ncbi:Type III restriction enzyme, res subunit [Gimesia panareensis]|uniref:Type III restriction enzyme, res subunit n=1 Tax=Gimesia panareensis TaxID=2527978 RepID=A0A517Q4Y9_9PLAN|nr:DEAD/DEAH box helicase family protein [Gimesia panareensis]QDT26667.1 Type III restriction enzyme, res subunit [Gimesia panareensis]
MTTDFPEVRFQGTLRPSQAEAIAVIQQQLNAGKKRLHIVAPPGSGKTVLGLFLWAEHVRQPALVLSPNSAIQSQWTARTDLFQSSACSHQLVTSDSDQDALLTSLTYQSVTLPRRGDSDVEEAALEYWIDLLIAREQAQDPLEAFTWIADLKQHNPEYYEKRIRTYRKTVRDQLVLNGNALDMLHASSQQTLTQLKSRGVGLIIFDECHHLMGHWGRVLADAHDFLEQPVIIGLTATPPDEKGKLQEDIDRYHDFFGPIDYEVPIPAVVKDGYLAPYQDLAYFVRPTTDELTYIANTDDQLQQIMENLCSEKEVLPHSSEAEPQDTSTSETERAEPLPIWLHSLLQNLDLPSGKVDDWATFERRDPTLADAARLFLQQRDIELPSHVPPLEVTDIDEEIPRLNYWGPVLDRYIRHRLRRSPSPIDQELASRVVEQLRLLGLQITETGSQPCASPVGRVIAYSQSKIQALVPVLRAEIHNLGNSIRAVVIADYEKTSATSAEVEHLLDEEAGGAIAAFKELVRDPETDTLNPVLLTGSSVLVDDDIGELLQKTAEQWLADRQIDVTLSLQPYDGFHVLNGSGSQWSPRVYVEMITDLFQQGLTCCLVGTRGLLGEGWDANKINVLIDLTTVTTSMTVNQLRGRSFRLDPDVPDKVANNWDIVCIAPEFTKGLDDYERFIKKHKRLFGVTDDGLIEKGVGHVHAAFTEIKPEGLEGSVQLLNSDMLTRASKRSDSRALWRIGEPYQGLPLRTIELNTGGRAGGGGGFPPFSGMRQPWSSHSLTKAVSQAVLAALQETGQISSVSQLQVGKRSGNYIRVFLDQAPETDCDRFLEAVYQVFGPLQGARYVIPRVVHEIEDTWISSLLPDLLGRYFRKRKEQLAMVHAVPSDLARNKELVTVFEKYWNQYVSPGEAFFAYRGQGAELLEHAQRNGLSPHTKVHRKEIFV